MKIPTDSPSFFSKKNTKKIGYVLLFTLLASLVGFFISDWRQETEPRFVDIQTPAIETDVPPIQQDVFLLDTSPTIFGDNKIISDFTPISVSESLTVTKPSIFIVEFDTIKPEIDRVFQDLLNNKHAVLFVGNQLDAEKIVPFFSESQIPVVPLEGTLPTFFQAYGAMYSVQAEDEVPVFFVTNETKSFNTNGFLKTLSSLDAHFSK